MMRPCLVAFAAAACLLLAAGSARAADPTIHGFDRQLVFPGSVLRIQGVNFSDVLSEVVVRIGGEPATVLEASLTEVAVFVPFELEDGHHPVEVEIEDLRSEPFELEVTTSEEDREEQRRRDVERHETVGPEAEVWQTQFITLYSPDLLRERDRFHIEAAGEALYPEGCIILVALKYEGRFVVGERARVSADGRFETRFGPFDPAQRLFPGLYSVEAEFSAHQQPARIRRFFHRSFPDQRDRELRSRATDRQFLRIGTPDDERRELAALQRHFETTLAGIYELLEELEERFCATGRSAFRTDEGEIDEGEWRRWLAARSLRGLRGQAFERRAEALAEAPAFTVDGYFDDEAWREWLDAAWRGRLLALGREHARFRDGWLVMRHHQAVLALEEALGVLMRVSQRRSNELYERSGLGRHASDRSPHGSDVLQLGTGPSSPSELRNICRRIERIVGIQQ